MGGANRTADDMLVEELQAGDDLAYERLVRTHGPAMLAVILETNPAVQLGEKRVVLTQTDVQAGLESTALLTHQNRTAGDQVAVVAFDAQALRIAVPAVA